ncbi:MAG: NUDIX hydrolase [Chlorobium sp.]|jgi:8-oxo-dGTP diphosphatase|nr:NUDIX hydrolase [Chlorobium sp.]MBV5304299.1 NUDIX hydrolase [Chlorobium sp.]
MRHQGASIIFFNSLHQVLLVLRDDIPSISCPGMWDLPGGHIEELESAEECIVREMLEEMEINVEGCRLFRIYEFSDRREYIFMKPADFEPHNIVLHEGQMIRWFSKEEVANTELACGFNEVLENYFDSLPKYQRIKS